MGKVLFPLILVGVLAAIPAAAAELAVPMNLVRDQGIGKSIGRVVTISEGKEGLVFTPQVTGLAAGVHGFPVHQSPGCSAAIKDGKMILALAAGGHYDLANVGKHEGPLGKGLSATFRRLPSALTALTARQ